jgi:ATP phosphoribosyltransferase regulatory subunit
MHEALVELKDVASLLEAYGVSDAVNYDLAEVRDLDYYTGITFEGFAPGLGFGLISGGRYDELVGHFGPPFPAVGWALTLDRVLLAREMQGVSHPEPAPHAILCRPAGASGFEWASRARARGLAIEIDPQGLTCEEIWRVAQARGVPRVLRVEGAALSVRDAGGQRQMVADDWEEMATWLSRR